MSSAALAGLVLALAPAAQAEVIVDDFNMDTSTNYYNYKYDTGAAYASKFDINDSDNGILQLDIGVSANALIHKTATLDIGESYKIDFLAASNVRGQIISNTNDGTSTTGHGYVARLRYNADGTLHGVTYGQGFSGTDTLGVSASIATSGTTVWMEREEAKKFNIYHNASGSQVLMGVITLNADPGTLYVGVQTHNASASYDNLEITAPAPSSTLAITSITKVGAKWELTLEGEAGTAYEFESSTTLVFPGTQVTGLTATLGVISGGSNEIVTTDGTTGKATVQMSLGGDPANFVRAVGP